MRFYGYKVTLTVSRQVCSGFIDVGSFSFSSGLSYEAVSAMTGQKRMIWKTYTNVKASAVPKQNRLISATA